jgi:hypothetical protein
MWPSKRIEVCDIGSSPHFIAATAMPARVWVWMMQATSARLVDRAVDHVAGLVDA